MSAASYECNGRGAVSALIRETSSPQRAPTWTAARVRVRDGAVVRGSDRPRIGGDAARIRRPGSRVAPWRDPSQTPSPRLPPASNAAGGRLITTKTLAIPAIALGCLVAHGAGIQAEHLDAEFDDGREGVELGRRMADWAGTISTTADLSNKQQRNDTPVASGAVSDNWDRADIKTVRLTPEVFPSLSADVVADLTRRRCVIPQPWLATEPANVVHGRFTVPGRTDAGCAVLQRARLLDPRVPWELDGPCGRVGARSRPRLSAGRGPWPDRVLA